MNQNGQNISELPESRLYVARRPGTVVANDAAVSPPNVIKPPRHVVTLAPNLRLKIPTNGPGTK